MREIRIHGRGGQGVAAMAEMMAMAFVLDGKNGASFPMFGSERRGGPVTAFARFDEKPILEKTKVYEPDCLILFDRGLMRSPKIYQGLKTNAILVVNSKGSVREKPHEQIKLVGSLNADNIALEELGRNIPNTCLLGAFAACTGWLGLKGVLLCLEEYFANEKLKANKACAKRGFEEVTVTH